MRVRTGLLRLLEKRLVVSIQASQTAPTIAPGPVHLYSDALSLPDLGMGMPSVSYLSPRHLLEQTLSLQTFPDSGHCLFPSTLGGSRSSSMQVNSPLQLHSLLHPWTHWLLAHQVSHLAWLLPSQSGSLDLLGLPDSLAM